MAGFKVQQFKGIRPRISARKLPGGEAQIAINTRLGSGDLRAWQKSVVDTELGDTDRQTIFLYDNDGTPIWFEWNSDVDIARGPIQDDELERVYITGDQAFPTMTYRTIANTAAPYPSDWRRLGLPPPAAAPAVSAPSIAETTVGNTLNITDGMTSNHFYLTILNSIWEQVNGTTPPEDERVYVKDALGSDQPIDIGIDVGDVFVVTVIDADNFSISNPDSEYLSKSSRPTSPRDGSTGDTALVMVAEGGGGANFAGFIHAPNGLVITKTAHGLFNNAEIIVRSVTVEPRWRYETGATAEPTGLGLGTLPYFLVDYPDTGPYPTGPDNTELTTHECTFNDAGNHFDIYGSFTIEVLSDGDGSQDTIEERAYVYTYVTALGEEGPPSPVSGFVEVVDGTQVTVDTFSAPPGSGAGYDITNIRIYRTNATDDAADFQFVAEVADDATEYLDSVLNEDLGELLPSENWDRPDENMQGITALANGMMLGFYKKTVFFCEPYFPHAWPAIYDKAVDYDIVGAVAIGTSVVLLTTGVPYIVTGAHPRNVSIRPYKINQACVSKRSAVTKDDRAIYASPDGLVELGIDGYEILTENHFTKTEWAARSPATIVAEVHDDKYFAFHAGGGFVFAPNDDTVGFSEIQPLVDLTLSSEFFSSQPGWSFSGGEATLLDGLFLGMGGSGQFNDFSPNGITWTQATDLVVSYQVMTYSPELEKFVAARSVGAGQGRVQFSDDASIWAAEQITDMDLTPRNFFSLFGLLIAIGDQSKISTSTNGTSWTERYAGVAPAALSYWAYNPNSGMVVVFPNGSTTTYVTSEDGITWTERTGPTNGAVGVVWDEANDVFVVVSSSASWYSSDGISWVAGGALGISVASGQFAYNAATGVIAGTSVGTSGNTVTYSSNGGQSWQVAAGPQLGQGRLTYGNGVFVASNNTSYATKTATDPSGTWTTRTRTDKGNLSFQTFIPEISGARQIESDARLSVVANSSLTMSATITSSAGGARAGIAWYDSGNNLIQTDYASEFITNGVSTVTAPAPATAVTAALVVAAIGVTTVSAAAWSTAIPDSHLNIEADTLYFTDGQYVYEWEGDTDNEMLLRWKSGQVHMQKPINLGAAIVEADAYPVTFKLYGDGTLRATRTVADDEPFRLPGGYLASTYEVELEGTETVAEVRVAETLFELAEG